MKKIITNGLKRGLVAAAGGPLIVAIVYAILGKTGAVTTFTVNEVVLAIFTSVLLAFLQGAITVVYTAEKLPTLLAAVLHGIVLYITYISIYLVNGWLQDSKEAILIFTTVFVITYLVIWAIVYLATRSSVKKLNKQI